ncbi:HlyC/CorC family transporter [Priestia filamentosa]|uniref:hemolysin family protein n=1 Tax=Priestia filamentosa TaxID=1402861 RepID=UPI001FB49104|nr:hemolysin family protein [Priestia filamentosa]MED3727889.1 hemolysin family protein [Priestia filamentosa]UOE60237.1 HlyC/CorC family transporter [Priestia filamentosa]
MDNITVNFILVAILIGLTAFFVATEFAIVKVRMSRIDQLVAEGKRGAIAAKRVTTHLDEYLSACQLGITVTAMGLGWLGEPTIERVLHPLFEALNLNEATTTILSFGIAFALMTYLHVVIGELAPKTVAIQKAELITLTLAKPIILFYRIMFPFIWLLNGSARVIVGLFGLKPASEHEMAHSEEELRLLLSESYKSGEINKNELKYVNNIFEFDERIAKEIMVPRTEMVTLSIDDSFNETIETLKVEKFTRYPIIDGDKDNIVGVINIKEVLTSTLWEDNEKANLSDFINPVIQVIETIPIHELMIKMQKERMHMAILIDEYGGTSGLVTIEDIVEEIVGEIRDEFDEEEIPEIRKIADDHYILNSKVLISDVNNLLNLNLEYDEVDTIGGWFLTQNFDAEKGAEIQFEGYTFKIREVEGHHISFVDVFKS